GFDEVWNERTKRWEYRDQDNQIMAYWSATENKIVLNPEITAIDFEKHKGLFVGWPAEQAEVAVKEQWEKKGILSFPLPFDPNSSSGLVEINTSLKIHLCFRNIEEGIIIKAPFSGKVEKFGTTNSKGFLIVLNNVALDFGLPRSFNWDSLGNYVNAGQPVLRLTKETLPPYFAGFGESYQFVICTVKPDFSEGYDTTFINLLRDKAGRLVYIR
ncbi:MAG: hypothetical protein H5T64_11270, partial [Chloroflexi bacterium]|nr:hypothetical protein [Chloroflexota bacterium]